MHAADTQFIKVIDETLERMEIAGPGFARLKDYVPPPSANDSLFSEIQTNEFMDFLKVFKSNPEAFQSEIEFLFPHPNTYEEALKDSITNILLIQRALAEQNKSDIDIIESTFKHPEIQPLLFKQLMGTHLHRYTCNMMLRMIDSALHNGDRKALIELHEFVAYMSITEKSCDLPRIVMDGLYSIQFGPEREFAKWKLMLMAAKGFRFRANHIPESWILQKPLYYGLMSRIMLTLNVCLSWEEKNYNLKRFNNLLIEFHQAVFANSFPPNSTPKQAKRFIIDKITKEIPEIVNDTPRFAELRDLDDRQMSAILTANPTDLERDVSRPNFMNFGKTDIAGQKEPIIAEIAESSARRASTRLAKKAQRRRQNKMLSRQNRVGQRRPKPNGEARSSSSEFSLELVNDAEDFTEPLVIDDKPEDETARKEKVTGESSSNDCDEEFTDSELSMPDEDVEYDEIQEEWKGIEEEQVRMIEHYRLLEKLKVDHAKLHRNNIRLRTESQIPKEKPRVVAFFHTDDIRQILPFANTVYVENHLKDRASQILNSGKQVPLQWIFNPAVKIDRNDYQFLCQLFNLSNGVSHLTFANFIRTFSALNPSKAKLTRKELARSVFQFEHAFETEDQVFIPPIGGAHREHLSSDFNHIEIRRFMMNGGAHPYFFQVI
jgi:hypothetical protein